MQKLPIKISLADSFYDAEEKCGCQVTHESKLLWAVILDLMVEFDRVCKQHHISYSLDSGSLLGAVRHNGFVPWDNDADIIMLRSEYERICQIAPKVFEKPYFWQTNDTDPGTVRRHAQLRNSMTTGILKSETKEGIPCFKFNQGIFLDIFVLDEVPDDEDEMVRFREELEHQITLLLDFKKFYWESGASPWVCVAQKQAYDQFETIATRYNGTGQKYIANITLTPQRKPSSFFSREIFEDLTNYKFEGFLFTGPRDFDTVLRGYYGDWHQLVIGGDIHGGLIIDTQTPYTAYFDKDGVKGVSPAEEHPLLQLYQQRDKAWNDLRTLESESRTKISNLIHENGILQNNLICKENEICCLQKNNERLNRKVCKKRRMAFILGLLSFILLVILTFVAIYT